MNTHLYPDIRRSPHFSIFRQEQNVTVIRKLSKAGLEEPRRAKECAWISNTVAADFFSFQRLSLDSRVWTMIEWVAFAALIHLQMNDSREVSAFIHTASHGPEAKGYHGKKRHKKQRLVRSQSPLGKTREQILHQCSRNQRSVNQ